jgi:pilus assembly protein Flp/PilA
VTPQLPRGFGRAAVASTSWNTVSFIAWVGTMKREQRPSQILARFFRDERGVTAIEYALLAAIMGVVIVVWATLMGNSLNSTFTSVAAILAG